jgi:AcrR family transcriptional regulator
VPADPSSSIPSGLAPLCETGPLRPAQAITESGPTGVSLRDLARRAGVSHAAPAHHFGDKAGLLTALAAEGFDLLADTLSAAQQRTGQFLEVGVAYVGFAVEHRAHFEVMFRPDLYHADDPAVRAAEARADAALRRHRRQAQRGDRSRYPARRRRCLVARARLRHPLAQPGTAGRVRRGPTDRGTSRR